MKLKSNDTFFPFKKPLVSFGKQSLKDTSISNSNAQKCSDYLLTLIEKLPKADKAALPGEMESTEYH